nr:MAG TPA: hypothetical protein [Inoviridae sp.]
MLRGTLNLRGAANLTRQNFKNHAARSRKERKGGL